MRSDRFQSAVDSTAPKLRRTPPADDPAAAPPSDPAVRSWQRAAVMSRPAVALTLIAAGIVWAVARGLEFYGVAPAQILYDLDQPPLLLVFVGTWFLYRSRRR